MMLHLTERYFLLQCVFSIPGFVVFRCEGEFVCEVGEVGTKRSDVNHPNVELRDAASLAFFHFFLQTKNSDKIQIKLKCGCFLSFVC